MGEDQQSADAASDPPIAAYNAGAVAWVYRGSSVAGILMAVGGVIAEVSIDGEMKSGLWPIAEVPAAIAAGEPSAWTTLGIWILLTGPVLALMSMFFTGIRRRSWSAVILSGIVLTVIILAIPTMTWIQGGV